MVTIKTVMKEIDKYLKTDMAKDLKDFEKRNGFPVYNQTKGLAEVAICDKMPDDYEGFVKLRLIYNSKDFPEFKQLVDKVLDHLKEVYKNEEIKLYNGQVVKGSNYFDFAKYSLTMAKDKEFAKNINKSNIKSSFGIVDEEEIVEKPEEVEPAEEKEPEQVKEAPKPVEDEEAL